jgi:hypothetical protein
MVPKTKTKQNRIKCLSQWSAEMLKYFLVLYDELQNDKIV